MPKKIVTWGYTGKSIAQLRALLTELGDAVIFDCRYVPYSRSAKWDKTALMREFGDQYRHVGAWGNRNYKNGGPIEIQNYTAGKRQLDRETRNIVLMCACKDPATCHRTTLANYLRSDGCEVSEYTPPDSMPAAPKPQQLTLF